MGPTRKFLPNYANIYITIHSHGLRTDARTDCATANEVRNGLRAKIVKNYEFVGKVASLRYV